MGETLDLARKVWSLYQSGDVEHLMPLVDDDVEIRPRGLPREVYRGHDGMRQMFVDARDHGRESTVTIDQYVASGDSVAVLGRIRVRNRRFIADSSAAWVLVTRDGKLAKTTSYRSHANALKAVRASAVV